MHRLREIPQCRVRALVVNREFPQDHSRSVNGSPATTSKFPRTYCNFRVADDPLRVAFDEKRPRRNAERGGGISISQPSANSNRQFRITFQRR